jgi:hypothetical protein
MFKNWFCKHTDKTEKLRWYSIESSNMIISTGHDLYRDVYLFAHKTYQCNHCKKVFSEQVMKFEYLGFNAAYDKAKELEALGYQSYEKIVLQ